MEKTLNRLAVDPDVDVLLRIADVWSQGLGILESCDFIFDLKSSGPAVRLANSLAHNSLRNSRGNPGDARLDAQALRQ